MEQQYIIGISGKMRAGKDTVAAMLMQRLKGFKKVALADPIKQAVADELEITLEKLEEFKASADEDISLGTRTALLREAAFTKAKEGEDSYVKKVLENEGNLIIPDVRTLLEVEGLMADSREVLLIRVESPAVVRKCRGQLTYSKHPTETELDNYDAFDYVVTNKWRKDELEKQVEIVVDSIKDYMLRS